MDGTGPHPLINPTTCFTIACVAFGLVAVSTIWKNHVSTIPAKDDTVRTRVVSRPQPQRRQAVDSLYSETRDSPSTNQNVERSRHAQILQLIALGAGITQSLRACYDDLNVELLGEVSFVITALCRLEEKLRSSTNLAPRGVAVSACMDAVLSTLRTTFADLEAPLSRGDHGFEQKAATRQLRDQRPVLDFILSSMQGPSLPPTPPAEVETVAAMENPSLLIPSLAPPACLEPHTGITPGVDEKCWIEPPPEYSPPTGYEHAVPAEKSELAIEVPAIETTCPAREDLPTDGEGLYEAVTDSDNETLVALLEQGADPSRHFGELQRTPLHQAAHLNHCTSLAILLRHGAVMSTEDVKGDTAVHLAAWAGNVEALATLLAHGADLDWLSGRDGYSPLWCAVSAYQIDAARLLLKHGARVSLRAASGGGLTPLHQAAVTGQSAMCELLLDRGAQPDCLDDDKNTPLHYAAASGSVKSVKVLLQNDADIEAQQIHGLTAVHWAAHKGHTDVLAALLEYGARSDRKAGKGATPLHLAANRGHVSAARLLLDKGVSKAGRATWDGIAGTPAEMAKGKGHVRLAKVLRC